MLEEFIDYLSGLNLFDIIFFHINLLYYSMFIKGFTLSLIIYEMGLSR